MKKTGILRRVDELGRIVIPKEIRKNFKIRDGENLEIFISDDKIILQKYSYMDDIRHLAQRFTDMLYSLWQVNIIITDKEKVIAASSNFKKSILYEDISDELCSILDRRQSFLEKYKKSIFITGTCVLDMAYVLEPILYDGDVIGLIVILKDEIGEFEERLAKIGTQFFTKYLED